MDFTLDQKDTGKDEEPGFNHRVFSTLDNMKTSAMLKLIADEIYVPMIPNSTWEVYADGKLLGKIMRDEVDNISVEVEGEDAEVGTIGTTELTAKLA